MLIFSRKLKKLKQRNGIICLYFFFKNDKVYNRHINNIISIIDFEMLSAVITIIRKYMCIKLVLSIFHQFHKIQCSQLLFALEACLLFNKQRKWYRIIPDIRIIIHDNEKLIVPIIKLLINFKLV